VFGCGFEALIEIHLFEFFRALQPLPKMLKCFSHRLLLLFFQEISLLKLSVKITNYEKFPVISGMYQIFLVSSLSGCSIEVLNVLSSHQNKIYN